jgi:hypothetical protein
MFTIDGCRISSNCSKEWSGTKKELLRNACNASQEEKVNASIERLRAKSRKIQKYSKA